MKNTIKTEDQYLIPFFNKTQISIERGEGVYVWDEGGKKYIDLTSGWGVTSIGHSNPVITKALVEQSSRILQSPNAGLTYSPVRAEFLKTLSTILPKSLNRIFFAGSGAEANDAAMKLARKISGRKNIISMFGSFHGRTIGTVSATAQEVHQSKFSPLMPNHQYVPYNDISSVKKVLNKDCAAVIVEPMQGEGGVVVPYDDYLQKLSKLCKENGTFLIVDEVQTGFYRTGKAFASQEVKSDFLTMAKGIAGGFPFASFAVSNNVSQLIEKGDHGGTYCGNPLGCSVANATIKFMLDTKIWENVFEVGDFIKSAFENWKNKYSNKIVDVRGKGLLMAIEFKDNLAEKIGKITLEKGVFLNINKGKNIRIFPALNITKNQMKQAIDILENIVKKV